MARQILIEHYDNQLGQLEASYDVEVGKFKDAIKEDIKDVNEKLKKLEAEEYVSDYFKSGGNISDYFKGDLSFLNW
jgi:hypothetical protein